MSLKDQLLKSGIASKKQLHQARKHKKQLRNQTDDTNIKLEEIQQQKKVRDLELNKQMEQERTKKAVQAQCLQIMATNAVSYEKGDRPYRFQHNKKIKTLYLSEKQANQISNGQLIIASQHEDKYYLLTPEIAEKLALKNSEMIITDHRKNKSKEINDDPYAEYVIPDDLIW